MWLSFGQQHLFIELVPTIIKFDTVLFTFYSSLIKYRYRQVQRVILFTAIKEYISFKSFQNK